MKILTLALVSILFFSCKKSNDPSSTRLLRTESTDYNGNLLYTVYGYDDEGRITTITQNINSAQPAVAVTISYQGNEATLISHPETEPTLNQTSQVILTLDADGKMLKRIEFTHGVTKSPSPGSPENFRYDTLLCEYDATGLLKSTTGNRYDSIWGGANFTQSKRLTSTVSYNSAESNMISSDEYVVYPIITRQSGVTTITGGSSEYHTVYNYTRAYPNKTDFKNSAILNEYKQYYEPLLNIGYKNMHDQMVSNNIDKDIDGTVIFNGNSTVDIKRIYNSDGLLSMDQVLSQNTQYVTINYFYGN